jgi:hypothetical protein
MPGSIHIDPRDMTSPGTGDTEVGADSASFDAALRDAGQSSGSDRRRVTVPERARLRPLQGTGRVGLPAPIGQQGLALPQAARVRDRDPETPTVRGGGAPPQNGDSVENGASVMELESPGVLAGRAPPESVAFVVMPGSRIARSYGINPQMDPGVLGDLAFLDTFHARRGQPPERRS